ncbi:hypothetical protein MMC18_001344 [Xylographa bjoerkii]|nr:hypothetical protein [Xylographa bjoerkii]
MKATLATQFAAYGKGGRFHDDWKDFLGDSIFTTDGSAWQASRRLIRPQFVVERISDLEVFEHHVQLMIEVIREGQGCLIDVNDLFLRYTLDTITDFLLGTSADSLEHLKQEFAKAFAEGQRVQALITKARSANILIPRASYHAALTKIDSFISPFIEQALTTPSDELRDSMNTKYTFLHALAGFT